MKIITKIKKMIFGEDSFEKSRKNVLRDNGLSVDEKYTKLIGIYDNYFKKEWYDDANMRTYELHYEQFMHNDRRNERDYNRYFNYELNMSGLVKCIDLEKDISSLINEGLNLEIVDENLRNNLSQIKNIVGKWECSENLTTEIVSYVKNAINNISGYDVENETIYF